MLLRIFKQMRARRGVRWPLAPFALACLRTWPVGVAAEDGGASTQSRSTGGAGPVLWMGLSQYACCVVYSSRMLAERDEVALFLFPGHCDQSIHTVGRIGLSFDALLCVRDTSLNRRCAGLLAIYHMRLWQRLFFSSLPSVWTWCSSVSTAPRRARTFYFYSGDHSAVFVFVRTMSCRGYPCNSPACASLANVVRGRRLHIK
jgi:hypothetical protein